MTHGALLSQPLPDLPVNRVEELIPPPALREHRDDGILFPEQDRKLAVLPVRAGRVLLSHPEEITVPFRTVFDLLRRRRPNILRRDELPVLPCAVRKTEFSEAVKLRQIQKEPASAEAVTQRIPLPDAITGMLPLKSAGIRASIR